MKVPISWLKEFVDLTIPIDQLAERLTLAGLEVAKVTYIGLPEADLPWPSDKLVLGHILKVEPHPDADRLVLATVDIGTPDPETVVTGAPNLFDYLGQGDISQLGLKSPFVMEGVTVYDGYSDEPGAKMTLKGRKIRGIMNRHMLCSEKELGLSDDHKGIIIDRTEFAPPGTPLVDLWGDAVLDIDLTPNLIRCASILGVAREVAALTGQELRYPDTTLEIGDGGQAPVEIETTEPSLNPRFIAILIEGITIGQSPYWMQRRLRLAGMRPINNIVDVSNYVMLEVGQPNHAFDWDMLRRRADEYAADGPVKLITRLAEPGEKVVTLDDKTHPMPDYSILVTDPKSNLSIGGIMGGADSEVSPESQNILLEAAAWDFINIRRTSQALNIYSEAAYRFSRGIHPEQAMLGALRGAKLMTQLAGGTINYEVVDYYPNPPAPVVIELPQAEVSRILGIELPVSQIKQILESLEFTVEEMAGSQPTLRVTVPDHRLDIPSIGSGGANEQVIGQADLMEEIARVYGYDRLPVSEIADELPPQRNNINLDQEETTRNLLVQLGLQEIITYRLTTPEAESRLLDQPADYITLANPSTPERSVMRQSLLNSVLEVAAENSKHQERVKLFEVGHIYLPAAPSQDDSPEGQLPHEQRRLAIVMTGPRETVSWLPTDIELIDFFDLKGGIEALLAGLHVKTGLFKPAKNPVYYPGRVAELLLNKQPVGLIGQLHPRLVAAYEFQVDEEQPVVVADFDLDHLLAQASDSFTIRSVSRFPAVQQDIALVVDEATPADQVESLIVETGQPLLVGVQLFDVFRGEQLGPGKKSLAYSLTFQDQDRTLTDKVVAKQQQQIVKRLEKVLGATLRS